MAGRIPGGLGVASVGPTQPIETEVVSKKLARCLLHVTHSASYRSHRTWPFVLSPPPPRSALSAQMLEVSLLGVGTVLRLERSAWSSDLRRTTNEYPPPLTPPPQP